MRHRGKILLALVGTLAAGPVSAQSAGTIELGIFGRWTKFGELLKIDSLNNLPKKDGLGGGARLGIFVLRNLEIEGDASYTRVDAARIGHVRYIPIHAGLTYNFPLGGKSAFLVGARFVHNLYEQDAEFDDSGFGAIAGFRFGPVRIDDTWDQDRTQNVTHGRYHNLGVQAGLSALIGNCKRSADGVTVSPSTATLDRGQTQTFTATSVHCGKNTEVNWTATGGTITEHGDYTAGQTPGSYLVTATQHKTGLTSTAAVTIKEPPPPPPPPPPPAPRVTLTRIDLTPDHARVKMNESVAFSVNGINSDGTTRAINDCNLTATGNATKTGNSFSWGRYGTYTVTASCEGMTDESTVEVPLEIVIFGTNFAFNKDYLTPAGRDSVRVAADSLKKYPEIQVRLAGHADFVGSNAYNCDLSWRRVHTVHHTLNSFGIPDSRFSAIEGFGEEYPVADDQVPQAWKDINTRTHDKGKWWDRRVDITSASKDAGVNACAEPTRPMRPAAKKKP
jgi:outer membrane protein OmpA-like peptidoglycan-associated protein